MRDVTAFVHEFAEVESGASVGSHSRVWQFASVIRRASIGADCTIGAGAMIDGVHVGDRCSVGCNAGLFQGCWIGDDVFIGPNVVLSNDRWPSTDKGGFDLAWLAENVSIRVHEFASIGANAVILPGVTIGRHSLVAAGAVVTENVPPGTVWTREGKTEPKPEGWRRWRMAVAR